MSVTAEAPAGAILPPPDGDGLRVLDLAGFRDAPLRTDPYPHVMAAGVLRPEALPALRADFPDIKEAGYHPLEAFHAHGAFATLLEEVDGAALSRAMNAKFGPVLPGVDFTALPRLVTVRKLSKAHEGRIHTDSESKVATLLIYMHQGWAAPEGRIRVLRNGTSFEDHAGEVAPDEGNLFAFLRGSNSWHGHTPFTGERRVVQIAWIRNQGEIDRKRKRHGLSRWFKRLFGR